MISEITRARSSAVEHFGDIEGVIGSNPIAPTISHKDLRVQEHLQYDASHNSVTRLLQGRYYYGIHPLSQ